ncbi:hypothetical protein [Actinoplanes aureus]|uniref:Uncharacterized protein n=1 Tax=Actinoplanes aureus TaxID=2792083 RepID=A0A931FY29_9ACTN|nr:hypothetical protein [Actinoplanes aureus]MBG0563145.1 hypothetical protein [Actinoplanes aureus]
MRHLRSILYALVLAPAIWVLAGVGFTHDLTSRGRELFAAESISGLLLLIFAGILYAILAFAPVSPAGPVLAGAAFLAVTIWAWNSPDAYAGLWAPEVSKAGFDLSRPGYGLAALLAIPLLGTALSARRWARYEPPVLPIIGEVARFRGAAKVPGIPVSIAETTVLRTGRAGEPAVPVAAAGSADETVAMPTASALAAASALPDDRTVAMPAAPAMADDRTIATPTAPAMPDDRTIATPTAPTAPDDRTIAMPAADSDGAWDPTIAVRTPEAEPTTVFVVSDDETTAVAARPAPSGSKASPNNPVITTNPEKSPGEPAEDSTTVLPSTKPDEATTRLPEPADDEETHRLTKPIEPATIAQDAVAAPPAKSDEPANLPEDPATPLTLPSPAAANGDEPTTYIPAQRHPSPAEA